MLTGMELGEQVSKARKAMGLTQEELAEKAAVTVRTIQRIENGETTPRSFTLKAIAAALDLPLAQLLQTAADKPVAPTAVVDPLTPPFDREKDFHFLQLFCLSCFSFIVVPYVHFLLPSYLLKKQKPLLPPVRLFAQKLLRRQIFWVVCFHLLLLLALAYNVFQAGHNNQAFLINYLWVVFFMYLLNAGIIVYGLLQARRLSAAAGSEQLP